MDQIQSRKIAYESQMIATALEGQVAQTTSRGHCYTCFNNEWPWISLAEIRHGRRNTCKAQQSPEGGFLSVSDTHRTAHSAKKDSHSSFFPVFETHGATHSYTHSEGTKRV